MRGSTPPPPPPPVTPPAAAACEFELHYRAWNTGVDVHGGGSALDISRCKRTFDTILISGVPGAVPAPFNAPPFDAQSGTPCAGGPDYLVCTEKTPTTGDLIIWRFPQNYPGTESPATLCATYKPTIALYLAGTPVDGTTGLTCTP